MRLYVGGYSATIQGERARVEGDRCYSAAHRLRDRFPIAQTVALLDSGAFTDPPERRLSPDAALERQLKWERDAARKCGVENWQPEALVSYDRLIDETWVGGQKFKRRWSLKAAEVAVEETAQAARFLAAQRARLAPRQIVLSCQGVDAIQYAECAAEVLSVAAPGDWIGLGGWCILGLHKTWLPEFWRTLHMVLPLVARAGIQRVHIFGVLWPVALGGLLWMCDRLGIAASCDSAAPMLACTRRDHKRAGVRCAYFRDNIAWWVEHLARLRESPFYREPPDGGPLRQLALWE